MRLRLALAAGLVVALGAGAFWLRPAPAPPEGAIAVPSGQVVTLLDVVGNVAGPAGLTARFRFLAPAIAAGGDINQTMALQDMDALCNSYALPRIAESGPVPAQIVISLSDIAVPFGDTNPEATQYFEAYSFQDGVCIWEAF